MNEMKSFGDTRYDIGIHEKMTVLKHFSAKENRMNIEYYCNKVVAMIPCDSNLPGTESPRKSLVIEWQVIYK